MQRFVGTLVVIGLAAIVSPAFAGITLEMSTYGNTTYAGAGAAIDQKVNTTGITSANASSGASTSGATSNFSTIGSGSLSASFTQAPLGASTYGGVSVAFIPSSNTTYSAAGSYANASGGSVWFFSHLLDFTVDPSNGANVYTYDPGFLTNSLLTISSGTPGFSGNLTGVLTAGHIYVWDAYVQSDSGLGGTGSASLTLGSLAAVPEA